MKIIITGAGGFIGSHLAQWLYQEGHEIIGIDIQRATYSDWNSEICSKYFKQFITLDLRNQRDTQAVFQDLKNLGYVDRLYHLAADMGGIGFIETNKANIMANNTAINLNTIKAAHEQLGVGRFLFTSSACVYPGHKQQQTDVTPLKEKDAYPADAEDGYGWEKLFMERMCHHFTEDYGLETRVVRFHNVFGPQGTWTGGREKSPAAICRKIAEAPDGGHIEVWGDGTQTRSYLFIDDCLDGLTKIMEGSYHLPLNLGQDRMVSINELVDIVSNIAGKTILRRHNLDAPQGVRGRNSDNTLVQKTINWAPKISLEEGLEKTYNWISKEISLQKHS